MCNFSLHTQDGKVFPRRDTLANRISNINCSGCITAERKSPGCRSKSYRSKEANFNWEIFCCLNNFTRL